MEQKISIKIAGRIYSLRASSPEKEEVIRKAAAEVNRTFDAYSAKFPGRGSADILAFVALNVYMNNIVLKDELQKSQQEASAFNAELEGYLNKIDKNSR